MGIYDREYYRRATRQSGWVTGVAPVVKWLIICNIVVFVLQLAWQPATDWLALSAPFWQVWRFVSYAFCHDPRNLLHLFFNMFLLYMFGRELENMYGSREFLLFYLTGAILSALGHIGVCFLQRDWADAIGASGAVMSTIFLYAMWYPRRQVFVFGILPLEIRWLAAIYLVYDLWPLLSGKVDGVAHAAHLAGAGYGIAYKVFDLRFSRVLRGQFSFSHLRMARRQPRVRVFVPPESDSLDQEVDRVLAKISREGLASLTDDERRIMERASQQYKQRRQ